MDSERAGEEQTPAPGGLGGRRARVPWGRVIGGGVALGLAGSLGCAAPGALQRAETLGRGGKQLGAELSYQAVAGQDTLVAYPVVGVSGRLGVSDQVDVGARVGPSGLEGQVKVQLSPRGEPGSIWSLAPYAGIAALSYEGAEAGAFSAGLPLLVGLPLGEGRQLVLSPRLHQSYLWGAAGSTRGHLWTLSGGASVGYAQPLPRGGTLFPELGLLHPLMLNAGRTDGVGGTVWGGRKLTVIASVAVLLGGDR